MDGVVKDEYFKPINVGYPDSFKKYIVDESGDALMVKKLPGADEKSYTNYVDEADKLLKERKYSEAKELYKKAVELKPNENYPKTQIEKIDKLLNGIDELFKKTFSN